jgi:hypothetical protein
MPEKGFFASLFDLSFSSFITSKLIKVLYVLTLILIGLAALAFIVSAFAESAALGLFVLVIVAPIVSLLYVIYARVFMEILIAVFRIMETNVELVALQRQVVAASAAPTAAMPATAPPPPPTTPPPPTV